MSQMAWKEQWNDGCYRIFVRNFKNQNNTACVDKTFRYPEIADAAVDTAYILLARGIPAQRVGELLAHI